MADSRLAERLAEQLGRPAVPGERVTLEVDRVVLDGPAAAAMFAAAGAEPETGQSRRVLVVAGTRQSREESRRVQRLAAEAHMPIALEPARAGLPGVVAVDEGLVGEQHIVVGTRPDVAALGALGCLVLRASPAELAGLLAHGSLSATVPRSLPVLLRGRVPRWMGGFELAVAVLEAIGAPLPGARGTFAVAPARSSSAPFAAWQPGLVVELSGPAFDLLTVPERLAAVTVLAQAGVPALAWPDEATHTWLAARRARARRKPAGSPQSALSVDPEDEAAEASSAEPRDEPRDEPQHEPAATAEPGARSADSASVPALSVQARALRFAAIESGRRLDFGGEGPARRISDVLLVGRVEELRVAAEVLRDRNVRRGLALHVVPASQRAFRHAIEEGLAADFLRAGAILRPPLDWPEPPAVGETRLSTWPADSRDVLVGPAVAAASAVAGQLTEPESMRRGHRRSARRG